MDLSYGSEVEALRLQVIVVLNQKWRSDGQRGAALNGYVKAFRRKAVERGYLYRGIPKEYGGSEQPVDVMKAQVIRGEFRRVRAPMEVEGLGTMMLHQTGRAVFAHTF